MPTGIANMGRICRGGHEHQRLLGGGRARAAEKYPIELCRECAKCFDVQHEADDMGRAGALAIPNLMNLGGRDGRAHPQTQRYKYIDGRTGWALSPDHV